MTRVEYAHWAKQARWISRHLAPAHLVEDMTSECMAALVVALRTYDPAKNPNLGGYVLQKFRWAVLDAMRVQRAGSRYDSAKGVFYEHVPLDVARDAGVAPAVSTDKIDLARAVAKLPPKRRRFVEAWLRLDDVALAAAEIGISKECAWQHHWHSVRTLRKILAA